MFKTGAYIVKGSERRKILGEQGELRDLSVCESFMTNWDSSWSERMTIQELLRDGWTEEPEKDWEPEIGDEFWHVMDDGKTARSFWYNTEYDRARRDFLGVYKSGAEAKAMVERVKNWRMGI